MKDTGSQELNNDEAINRDTPVVLGFYGTSPLLLRLHVLSPQGSYPKLEEMDPISGKSADSRRFR